MLKSITTELEAENIRTRDRIKSSDEFDDTVREELLSYLDRRTFSEPAPGVYLGHLNLSNDIEEALPALEYERRYPSIPGESESDLCCYGVCDSVAQFLERVVTKLAADQERTYVCTLCHIAKVPGEGGWRWHKWGPYIGDHASECEYLANETGFDDGVYVYSILQIEGPIFITEFQRRLREGAAAGAVSRT